MGCNSQVYGGADLHHLNHERKGACSIHKEDCPKLTYENLQKIYDAFDNDIDDWYNEIARAIEKPYIFDASKQVNFAKERVFPESDLPIVAIELHKHPMRAMASDVYNRLLAKKAKIVKLDDAIEYFKDNMEELLDFVQKRLQVMKRDFQVREELKNQYSKNENIVLWQEVKYEDYMEDYKSVCSTLLGAFDLSLEEDCENYYDFEHHPITGNMGPLWKAREKGKVSESKNNYRKNYYMSDASSMVIDNKYKDLFSQEIIERIESIPVYSKLVQSLNYTNIK